MQDLDLKSLRLLVAVCDAQNIKLAAEQEHIEPSAISKRIAQLEVVLKTPLLVRGRRGVQPTPAGLALLEHARTVLHTMERIEADVASFQRGIKGQVRLVASMSAIGESLLDDIAEFMRDEVHRNIEVDIEERFSKDLVRVVGDGAASLGVCWDSIDFQGLERLPYRSDGLVLAVHPDHPLAGRSSLRFEETLPYEHVGLSPSTAVYGMLQRAAARSGRTISYRVVVTNFDAALRVVEADLGISVIPRQIATRGHRDGRLCVIALADAWARRRFAICFRDQRSLQPAAAQLAQFLASKAAAVMVAGLNWNARAGERIEMAHRRHARHGVGRMLEHHPSPMPGVPNVTARTGGRVWAFGHGRADAVTVSGLRLLQLHWRQWVRVQLRPTPARWSASGSSRVVLRAERLAPTLPQGGSVNGPVSMALAPSMQTRLADHAQHRALEQEAHVQQLSSCSRVASGRVPDLDRG